MKKYLYRYIIASLLLMACYLAPGQNFYASYLPQPASDTLVANSLAISLYNNNFVKNNEYFGPYTEGITYIGSIFQPEVSWALSSKFSLSAGWYFRFFYGQDGFQQSLPVIRARYIFKPGAQLIFGQLYGQLQHGFLEPIYNTDNYFIDNPEYGVQFLINRKRVYADLYMDWEKFLLPGEAHQEVITGGLLASYHLNDHIDNRGLSVYFQSLIHHFGGQVDNSDNPLQSRANIAAGLKYVIVPELKMVNRITLSSSYIQSLELSQTNTIPFESGFGLQNNVTFENEWAKLSGGWFHGEYFFAPMGDYLFQSISQLNNWYIADTRDLITAKLFLGHQIMKGVNFGFLFESYYDTHRKSNDFSYGLNISVDAKVYEKTLKKGKN
jgi:hypothetical protein